MDHDALLGRHGAAVGSWTDVLHSRNHPTGQSSKEAVLPQQKEPNVYLRLVMI